MSDTTLTNGRSLFLVLPRFSLPEAPPFQVLLELFAHSGRKDERLERGLVIPDVDRFAILIETEALGQFQQISHDMQRYLLGYTRREPYNIVELGEVTILNHSIRLVQHKELDVLNLASYFVVLTCDT